MLNEYLRELERVTGRPYVLAAFGDHQPHTFTSTAAPPWSNHEYRAERRNRSPRETFLHIRSSGKNVLDCCGPEPPPATMLATLVSAMAASSLDDLYLPEHFYLYEHCGSDMLPGDNTFGFGPSGTSPAAGRSKDCEEAYRRWLSAIRREHVF